MRKYGRFVYERDFTLADGTVRNSFLFGSDSTPVVVFPFTKDKKVIAIRQFRYGINDFIVELPGGLPKKGQSFDEAVKAELLEETGYECPILIKLKKGAWFDPASFRNFFVPFVALDCKKVQEQKLDRSEIIQVVEFSCSEWMKLMHDFNSIGDAKTIAITFLASPFLK